jgi:CheY-like chemotaxis protein
MMVSEGKALTGRSVLVVEDESLVAMQIQDTLEDIGCIVVGLAPRLEDALRKARSLVFDVAVLDVNLNGSQSFPITDVLAERGLPFVFATGYSASSLPEILRSKAPVVQKPFRQHDLEQALRTALGIN